MVSSPRSRVVLTVTAIKAAKGRDKPYKLSDSEGLYLLIFPEGSRCWRMNYRHLGKQKTLAFGTRPSVSLADARGRRDIARARIARGEDPGEHLARAHGSERRRIQQLRGGRRRVA